MIKFLKSFTTYQALLRVVKRFNLICIIIGSQLLRSLKKFYAATRLLHGMNPTWSGSLESPKDKRMPRLSRSLRVVAFPFDE